MASGAKPYFQENWFAVVFLAACFGVGYLLFRFLMPPVDMSSSAIQTVAMAKLFAQNRFVDAFTHFNQPPIYALLQSFIIRFEHTTELPRLVHSFHQLNMVLYFISIVLVHIFISRQIAKPYTFIITALYTVAPSTLDMAWTIGPQMAYMVLSMAALWAVDYSLSQSSAMAGQITRGELVLCGSFLALGILTQQVGYMVVVAFFFVMLKRFGLKHSATVLAALMLIISPFIGRDLFHVIRKPQPYVASSAALLSTASNQGIFKTLQRYADNLLLSVANDAVGNLNLSPLETLNGGKQDGIPNQIGIGKQPWGRWALGIIAIIGAAYGLYRYTGIGTLYLCTYVLTALVLLPHANLPLAPVLPLLLLYLYYGMLRTGEWMKRLNLPITHIAIPVLTVWIALCAVSTHVSQMSEAKVGRYHRPKVRYMNTAEAPQNRLEVAQTEAAHRRAMDWLKAHTEPDAKVAIPRPEAVSVLNSQQKDQDSALARELSQYDYLVEENAGAITSLRKKRGALVKGHGLNLVYEDVPGRIRIWEVKPSAQ